MKEGGTVFMLAFLSCPTCLERSTKRDGKGEIRIQSSGLLRVSLSTSSLFVRSVVGKDCECKCFRVICFIGETNTFVRAFFFVVFLFPLRLLHFLSPVWSETS